MEAAILPGKSTKLLFSQDKDLMVMDTIFATLVCFLLALSLAVAQAEKEILTITPTGTIPGLNLKHTTAMATPSTSTVISNLTVNTTPFTSTTWDNETYTKTTAATSEGKSHLHTSQSTTILTPVTNDTSLKTTTPGTHTPTSTALTTPAMQTTGVYISTANTTIITYITANSSQTVNITSDSMNRTAQGLALNISEKNMTIVFSVVLGVFAMALVVFMFHRCKQKIQYLHQPLNTDFTDAFVADNDALVISGGLYDGHPIYDNVPTAQEDQSQFCLEFLN